MALLLAGLPVEVPAATLMMPAFLRYFDFVSIGTNDLIQYTLAVDRADDTVSHLYDPLHPAILQLVAHIIRGTNKAGLPVAVNRGQLHCQWRCHRHC